MRATTSAAHGHAIIRPTGALERKKDRPAAPRCPPALPALALGGGARSQGHNTGLRGLVLRFAFGFPLAAERPLYSELVIPGPGRPPRPAGGRKGSDSLGRQQNECILHSMCKNLNKTTLSHSSMCKNAERNEAVRITSPAHAPRLTDLPH